MRGIEKRSVWSISDWVLFCYLADSIDRHERLGQTPFGSCWSISPWYQIYRVSHGEFIAEICWSFSSSADSVRWSTFYLRYICWSLLDWRHYNSTPYNSIPALIYWCLRSLSQNREGQTKTQIFLRRQGVLLLHAWVNWLFCSWATRNFFSPEVCIALDLLGPQIFCTWSCLQSRGHPGASCYVQRDTSDQFPVTRLSSDRLLSSRSVPSASSDRSR
jgi:hypothetical protein